MTCSRRMFLLGTATTFAGAFLAACGEEAPEEIAKTDVPVGSAVILDKFIIAQPSAGQFVAYSAVCPHQQKKITKVEGETVKCVAHGSVFNIATGARVSGPAVTGLREVEVIEAGDKVEAQNPAS
ncbi:MULTISPECIES: Rieske (2Fe-2S) protein [Corynebacterium]|uniref:Rieske (2Fe-2S) protein n=1 Tax=Corynebacterium coyleae TaxID=53374 RepID=A0AAP6XMW7_9CORY|nr:MULTISPECIES: Rieske (2Fe-2S) protein [Corynebacterium]MDK8663507.1 Rieske (2Fe-2S) protein [Corynebacterium coyleae]MDK8707483.1 Rieske (2Fe-2S) protein [Corynebacterium coyleae]MDK8734331.1 Rieske (2Fe-2S) protein [Corynebacterium coyleae]MDK8893578.1 Rieske (2Fe-2S) protein [Corynebacterium coyleae]NJJ04132.1 Rieske (2Fe-2S) protein [Corynebacterium coyleae]